MKSLTKTIAIAALLTGASGLVQTAQAEGWYGRLDIGTSTGGSNRWADNGGNGEATFDFEDEEVLSVALGRRIHPNIRIEGEIAHRANELEPIPLDLDNGKIETLSWMVNVFADFNAGGAFQPYVGVGVGIADIDAELFNSDNPEIINDRDMSLAFQGAAGVAFKVSENLAFDLGYRYFTFHGADFDGTDGGDPQTWTVDYNQQAVTLGARLQFGGG